MTLSPSLTLVTADPTASTQPAFSWPIVYGSCTCDFSAHWPSRMCRSVRHTPAPPILTTTSNGPVGVGDGYLFHLEVLVIADHLDGSHGAHRSAPSFVMSVFSGMKVVTSVSP